MDSLLISDGELASLARKRKVTIGTIEKDYAVTHMLYALAQSPIMDKMVFKGGTAMKKAHFADFRYSEDLDFTISEDVSGSLPEAIQGNVLEDRLKVLRIVKEDTGPASRKFRAVYVGNKGSSNSVRIDMSLREKVRLPTSVKDAIYEWDDVPPFKLTAMHLQESLAEKVRAMLNSPAPRHLYDLNFLLDHGIALDVGLAEEKLAYYGYGFTMEGFAAGMPKIAKTWFADLHQVVPGGPPSFESESARAIERMSGYDWNKQPRASA